MIKSITFFVMQIRVIFALPSLVPSPLVPWAAAPVAYPSIHHCSAVSPQMTEAINPAVGWRYFSPGPRLPPQPPSITARWLVRNYTAW